jgi:hypothetical protein
MISWWMMEKLGRRKTMVESLIVAGISLIANGVVDISGYSHHPVGFWFNLVRSFYFEAWKVFEA